MCLPNFLTKTKRELSNEHYQSDKLTVVKLVFLFLFSDSRRLRHARVSSWLILDQEPLGASCHPHI